jgi:hypothetical protein
MTPEPLSRRRPLSSTGAGVSNAIALRSRCSTLAGPCDAVIDVNRSRRLLRRQMPYFFFRRFVFFAPFFAADLVFVFRFFAIAALLAIL